MNTQCEIAGMPAKTPAQRKADERARKRASGLVEVTVWVPAARVRAVRDYADHSRRSAQKHGDTK